MHVKDCNCVDTAWIPKHRITGRLLNSTVDLAVIAIEDKVIVTVITCTLKKHGPTNVCWWGRLLRIFSKVVFLVSMPLKVTFDPLWCCGAMFLQRAPFFIRTVHTSEHVDDAINISVASFTLFDWLTFSGSNVQRREAVYPQRQLRKYY